MKIFVLLLFLAYVAAVLWGLYVTLRGDRPEDEDPHEKDEAAKRVAAFRGEKETTALIMKLTREGEKLVYEEYMAGKVYLLPSRRKEAR